MKESEYQAIVKLAVLNTLKRVINEEYAKTEHELRRLIVSDANNQIAAFIELHYFDTERSELTKKVAERFNMPLGIADQLISYYTT